MQKPIPFSPPRIDEKTIEAVTDVLRSGWITTGPKTLAFENRLAEYIGGCEVVALNSWTNACELVLRWFGVGVGDEVILPAYTYAATANIVIHCGATPVLIDSAEGSCHVDIDAIAKAITSRTKVIMPVDVGGLPVDYDRIWEIIEARSSDFRPKGEIQKNLGRILFLADAAHSFGALYKGEQIGRQADVTGYSFHAVKNLTTAEGGALVFNLPAPFDNAEIRKAFKVSSLHGQSKDALSKTESGGWRYDVSEAGYKCNMTDIHAVIGLVELERYDETLAERQKICERYQTAFHDERFICPTISDETRRSSYHLYQLRLKGAQEADRDALIDALKAEGISSNVHFQPLPLLSFYQGLGYKVEDYPNAMAYYENEISLPVWYGMSDEEIDRVTKAIKRHYCG